jgi:VanZ family protein
MKVLLIWLGCVLVLSVSPAGDTEIYFPFSDTLMHMALYAITCALIYVELKLQGRFPRLSAGRMLLFAVVLASAYGLLMEVAQQFTETRAFSLSDAAANVVGAAAAAVFIRRREKRPGHKGG